MPQDSRPLLAGTLSYVMAREQSPVATSTALSQEHQIEVTHHRFNACLRSPSAPHSSPAAAALSWWLF